MRSAPDTPKNTQLPDCIWKKAEVVRRRECRADFECPACRFDRALRRTARENRLRTAAGNPPSGPRRNIVFWKDRLRTLPQRERPCIHHMKERIPFRACTREYRCGNCEFDQYFNDEYMVHAVVKPVDLMDVEGFTAPQGFYLHPGHAWVRVEQGGEVRVGLDDFALRIFGPLSQIEAPLVGKRVERGQPAVRLVRDGQSVMLLSPVSGVVTAINMNLRENAAAASAAPYAEGWIMRVQADDLRGDVKHLSIGDQAETALAEEVDRLYGAIEETAGPLAADGGLLGADLIGNLPELGFHRMAKLFLRSEGEIKD